MKEFIRTLAGKTLLFLLCIVFACTLIGSILGIVVFTQYTPDFYTKSEQEIQKEITADVLLRSCSYNVLWDAVDGRTADIDDRFDLKITDGSGNVICNTGNPTVSEDVFVFLHTVYRDAAGTVNRIEYSSPDNASEITDEVYTVWLLPKEGTDIAFEVSWWNSLLHIIYNLRYIIYGIAAVSLLLMIVCFVALMYAAGRRAKEEGIFPGPLYRIPFDLLLLLCVTAGVALLYCAALFPDDFLCVLFVLIAGIVNLCILLGLCMSAACRVKQHALLKGTLIYKICNFCWKILKNLWIAVLSLARGLPLVWKTGLVLLGISFFELILIAAADRGIAAGLLILERLLLIPGVLWLALLLRKLQKGGEALAAGDLSYQVDIKGMPWDLRQHGENLNRISCGISAAVEDRLKSERMKTELIANVSHDIKTPLTSIINYADLIDKQPCSNETIKEYAGVLVRQAEKLKRLLEDLVEASAASTGNLDVLLAPCDAAVFLSQTSGEFEEKLRSCGLTLITKQPEQELHILADGRRMQRIFDNLMNNICKYALTGTRVYLSLETRNNQAIITFKNTSRESLDMTADELAERFTRGDASRNTEGNGLGLAIAKSLTELQGGTFSISSDGDLFKVSLIFPLI